MTGRYGTQDAKYRADVLRYNGVGAALRTIISDVEHGIDRITRHQTTAAQATAAVTIEPTTGGPVSAFSDTLHNIAARLEKFDEEALGKLEAVQGSDVTRELFSVVAGLTRVDPTPEFNAVVTLLKAFLPPQPAPQAEPSFTPAGPQVAGQA